ncbi:hypothetical protein ACT4R9_01295 [Ornithobacterium rhinotracheale]|uniref:hypothetical protein n=1 Tax=Ornithobacterium rhinotracheale TaxID=28251 RepID=UPI003FA48A89
MKFILTYKHWQIFLVFFLFFLIGKWGQKTEITTYSDDLIQSQERIIHFQPFKYSTKVVDTALENNPIYTNTEATKYSPLFLITLIFCLFWSYRMMQFLAKDITNHGVNFSQIKNISILLFCWEFVFILINYFLDSEFYILSILNILIYTPLLCVLLYFSFINSRLFTRNEEKFLNPVSNNQLFINLLAFVFFFPVGVWFVQPKINQLSNIK